MPAGHLIDRTINESSSRLRCQSEPIALANVLVDHEFDGQSCFCREVHQVLTAVFDENVAEYLPEHCTFVARCKPRLVSSCCIRT